MSNQKKQALKRLTYICLTLSLMLATEDLQAGIGFSRCFKDQNVEDSSPPRSSIPTPKKTDQINTPQVPYKRSTIAELSDGFKRGATEKAEKEKQRGEKLKNAGKKLRKVGSLIADVIIKRKVKGKKEQNELIELKNEALEELEKIHN